MAVDAESEFDQVQSTFDSKSNPILTLLQTIADDAAERTMGANPTGKVDYLTPAEVLGEAGFTNVSDVSDPVDPGDPAIFQTALDYLDFLQTEVLVGYDFPDYTTIIDTPPTEPTLDTSDPEFYTLSEIDDPVYDVPVWDGDWTGGDVENDATVAPLVKAFVWPGTAYTSKLIVSGNNVLYDLIKADLQSNDYGVDDLDDGRVFERAYEREQRVMGAAVGDALRTFSVGGFEIPVGATAAAISRIQRESRDRLADVNRDILIQKSALFLEAKKLAVATGIQIETLEQGFYHSESDRLLKRLAQEIESTVAVAAYNLERIKMHIEKYRAWAQVFAERVTAARGVVELFSARVTAEGTKAQVNRTLVDNLIAKNKNLIDIYMAQLEGFKSVIDGRVRYHSVLADAYKSRVSQVGEYISSTKGAYDLVASQHKTLVDFEIGKFNGKVAAAKTKLDEIIAALQIKVDQIKTEAQATASVAAAAMSALNVNLGLSLSGSTNISGSETYSHDMTKGTSPGDSESTVNYHYHDETKSTTPGEQRTIMEYDGEYTINNNNFQV